MLESRREGAAVATARETSDVSTVLRFAGWLKSMNHEPMQCLGMFLSVTADDAQDFTTFLTSTRKVSYGTVANYLDSLLNMIPYVSANAQSLESIHHAPFHCECAVVIFSPAHDSSHELYMVDGKSRKWQN